MNAKQMRFVEEYLVDMNATQAAIRAGYSEKTAYSMGSRLLKNAEVQARIRARTDEINKQLSASQLEVRQFLTAVMRGEKTEKVPLFVDRGEQELVEAPAAISSRVRAAELLGKCFGMFTDNVVADVKMPTLIAHGNGSVTVDVPD